MDMHAFHEYFVYTVKSELISTGYISLFTLNTSTLHNKLNTIKNRLTL